MGGRKRIYVVDDEADLRALVCDTLKGYGYIVTPFRNGRELRQAVRREAPDLCILDLGLPDGDGLSLVREMGDASFGLVILTGRGGVSDRVLGLELGADDYIVKPFEPRELVARVNSVIRRRDQLLRAGSGAGAAEVARFGDWSFDTGSLTLTAADGREETVTAAEANLLLALLRAPKRVLSREQLQDCDPGRDDPAYDRNIDGRISRIRKKIEADPKSPRLIKTVYGAGYVLAAEVTWSGR